MHASIKKSLSAALISCAALILKAAPLQAASVPGFALDQVAAELSLSAEQRERVEHFLTRWMQQRRHSTHSGLREEFMHQFTSERLDIEALEQKTRESLREWEAALPALLAELAVLHQALTAGQRAQLAQWMKERGGQQRRRAGYWRGER